MPVTDENRSNDDSLSAHSLAPQRSCTVNSPSFPTGLTNQDLVNAALYRGSGMGPQPRCTASHTVGSSFAVNVTQWRWPPAIVT